MITNTEFIKDIQGSIELLLGAMARLQMTDGGFKGFYCHDTESGIWSTAEIVHTAAKTQAAGDRAWLQRGCEYLLRNQNPDGGWPFRAGGKSVTDVTAWCCLAASHFGWNEALRKGLVFILKARTNEGETKEQAWGLTTFETDRVYSTWIACYCLSRLLRVVPSHEQEITAEIHLALAQAVEWLLQGQRPEGSWGPTQRAAPTFTSTAVALLTLFLLGKNPSDFARSLQYLRSGISKGLWEPEDEIVVTREGYELSQQWFTSTLCFRVMIFYAEMSVVAMEEIDDIFRNLMDLIRPDGNVRLHPDSSAELVWTIPFMMDAASKYKGFVASKDREYRLFLERKRERLVGIKKSELQGLLQHHFPYPVSHVFFEFQHELDHHRRFQIGLQLYEVLIKYAGIVGLLGYLAAKESVSEVDELLAGRFAKPTLGDWGSLFELLLKRSSGLRNLLSPIDPEEIHGYRRPALGDGSPKSNLNEALSSAISLRNSTTGHGALKTLYEYKQMVEAEEGRLFSLIERMSFLAVSNSFLVLAADYDEFGEGDRYRVRVFKGLNIVDDALETSNRLSEGQKETMVRYIYFQNTTNGVIVNLYPFISYMFCDECKREQFFFYNGTKSSGRISYLSYGCGHPIERDNLQHFQKRLSSSRAWTGLGLP